MRSIVLISYLLMIGAALFRRTEYRRRLIAYFIAAYAIVACANLAHPGSVAEVGLVATPILVLVLCGSAAARIAILTSFTILLLTPFLRQPAPRCPSPESAPRNHTRRTSSGTTQPL